MTPSPQKDDPVADFLRKYRPLPPPAREGLERQLLAQIQREPLPLRKSLPWPWWAIPGLLVAGLTLAVGGQRLFAPEPPLAGDSEVLEEFLVTSWQGAMGHSEMSVPDPQSSWLVLVESDRPAPEQR
ncbi:MAG: hypothetical protein HC890_05585 [Chloroflexaceae bacterium]|nr:hypothetical protein [Chloroflexaceae bacterium]